jgi:hypothetical protein
VGNDTAGRSIARDDPTSTRPWVGPVKASLSAVAIAIGLLLILIAATLGSCDAFGGRCPADRPSLWDDDVFGMAAFGTALIVAVPVYLRRPSWRRLGIAMAVGSMSALAVGLLVTISAHG